VDRLSFAYGDGGEKKKRGLQSLLLFGTDSARKGKGERPKPQSALTWALLFCPPISRKRAEGKGGEKGSPPTFRLRPVDPRVKKKKRKKSRGDQDPPKEIELLRETGREKKKEDMLALLFVSHLLESGRDTRAKKRNAPRALRFRWGRDACSIERKKKKKEEKVVPLEDEILCRYGERVNFSCPTRGFSKTKGGEDRKKERRERGKERATVESSAGWC